MPKYFIGNILSPTETQPEADDPTFAFTREESQSMSMKDIPIRMEHHPDMVVGNIIRDWDAVSYTHLTLPTILLV